MSGDVIETVLREHGEDEHGSCYCGEFRGGAAHQAERIRAALTAEWGVDWTAYREGVIRVEVEDQARIAASHDPLAKVVTRTVTPWTEATP